MLKYRSYSIDTAVIYYQVQLLHWCQQRKIVNQRLNSKNEDLKNLAVLKSCMRSLFKEPSRLKYLGRTVAPHQMPCSYSSRLLLAVSSTYDGYLIIYMYNKYFAGIKREIPRTNGRRWTKIGAASFSVWRADARQNTCNGGRDNAGITVLVLPGWVGNDRRTGWESRVSSKWSSWIQKIQKAFVMIVLLYSQQALYYSSY